MAEPKFNAQTGMYEGAPTTPQEASSLLASGRTSTTQPISTPTPPTPDTTGVDSTLSDLYKKYGLGTPTTPATPKAPTLNQAVDLTEVYGLTPEKINANLEAEKATIKQRYDFKRTELASNIENQRKSSLSGLYSTGVVDPRSSGVASVGTASSKLEQEGNRAIDLAQAQEMSDAETRAFNQKVSVAGMKKDYLTEQNKLIQQSFENERQAVSDSFAAVNNVLGAVRSAQSIDQEEKSSAQTNINFLLTNFGSKAFSGMKEDDLAALEKGAGYPTGSLTKGLQALKEKELLGKAGDLREVGGSLYNITTDANGNKKVELLIKKPATGEAGGGVTTYDTQKSVLEASRGSDGYVNTDTYKAQRAVAKDKTGFDKNFSYMLNPNDPTAQSYLSSKKTLSAAERTKAVKYLSQNGGDSADLNLLDTNQEFANWVLLQANASSTNSGTTIQVPTK